MSSPVRLAYRWWHLVVGWALIIVVNGLLSLHESIDWVRALFVEDGTT